MACQCSEINIGQVLDGMGQLKKLWSISKHFKNGIKLYFFQKHQINIDYLVVFFASAFVFDWEEDLRGRKVKIGIT